MKFRATFEKYDLKVGISSEIPFTYEGPEQKYALADLASQPHGKYHVLYQGERRSVELDITTAELVSVLAPARFCCHRIISQLPESALEEATEELSSIRDHYLEIAEQRAILPLPKDPPLIPARVRELDRQ